MNCRFTPIDERNRVMRALGNVHAQVGVALQHSPGEGSGAPS